MKLTKKEKDAYKKILIEKREAVVGEITNLESESLKKTQRDSSGELSGYTFHMADVATDNYDREMSLNLASAEKGLMKEIEDALGRLQENTFGKCEDCKCDIPKGRLKSVPYAKMCIKCQEKHEVNTRQQLP